MNKEHVYSLLKSFKYAFKGISYCVMNERNMRIHLVIAAVITYFSYYFNLTATEQGIVFLTVALVIACEMLNTAIETVINFCTPYYSNYAKIVKDIAAGAVLVAAFFSTVIGIKIFYKPNIIITWISDVLLTYQGAIISVAVILFSVYFIFIGPKQIVKMFNRFIFNKK